jgi:hypothetical protein
MYKANAWDGRRQSMRYGRPGARDDPGILTISCASSRRTKQWSFANESNGLPAAARRAPGTSAGACRSLWPSLGRALAPYLPASACGNAAAKSAGRRSHRRRYRIVRRFSKMTAESSAIDGFHHGEHGGRGVSEERLSSVYSVNSVVSFRACRLGERLGATSQNSPSTAVRGHARTITTAA